MLFLCAMLDLVGHREAAEEFYATDPEYREAAAEVRETLWGIHDRVIALDIEGTLACNEIGSWGGRRVEFHDRVRRPLANEFSRALIDGGNQVVIWTGLGAASACSVMSSAGLKIFKTNPFWRSDPCNLPTIKGNEFKVSDEAELIGRRDYRNILEILIVENHPFAQRVFQSRHDRDREGPLDPEQVARAYTSSISFKIPSALGADVLVDDAADFFRWYGSQLYGPKEGARYLALEAFRVSCESDPCGYLRGDRALLEIARKLPNTLTEIDNLPEISIEEVGRNAEERKRREVAAESRRLARKSAPVKTAVSDFGRFLLRLLSRSR